MFTAAAFKAQAGSCIEVMVQSVQFFQCGSTWYQPRPQGGETVYVVVQSPL
jgi:hypothetical protein